MSERPVPVVNGRPWTSIIASGAVREWGAMVVLAGFIGAFVWGVREHTQTTLKMMADQGERHSGQMDRLLTLIIQEVVGEQKVFRAIIEGLAKTDSHIALQQDATTKDIAAVREALTQIAERQRAFRRIAETLLERSGARQPTAEFFQTSPPGRRRGDLPAAPDRTR